MGLTESDLSKFKSILLDLKKKHTGFFEGKSADIKQPEESKGTSQHHADGGTDDFDRVISIEVTSKEMKLLKQIDRALEKIEEGTYGICDISGEPISIKRLEAIPYAVMTRDAQEKAEKGIT